MDKIATTYLDAYARGGEVEGGWKYARALQQARLDFTDDSLGRLDQLLAQVRERARPTAADLATPAGRNFAALVAFYVIELVRRRSGAAIEWHDRVSARLHLPEGVKAPPGDAARLVAWAPDQRAAFWTLAWVEAQVLGRGTQRPPSAYVAGLIAHLERAGRPVWWTGMEALGRIASWQMMMAADGGSVLPTMLSSASPETWVTLAGSLPGDDVDAAIERAGRLLEGNPDDTTWQVLACGGHAELAQGRQPAVVVSLATYGKAPLRVKIAFPYRPATASRRFAILEPTLVDANLDDEQVAMLRGAMQRGIASVKWSFGLTWDELCEAPGRPAAAKRPAAPMAPSAVASAAPTRPARPTRAPAGNVGPQAAWVKKPAWKFW